MSALSSVAALPLITTSSIANGSPNAYSRPDLAARFDDFYARWKQKRESDALESAACNASGLNDNFEWSDPDLNQWAALSAEGGELVASIMSQRANSLADIVLQARACAIENSLFWTDEAAVEAMDSGISAQRHLVDRICELAGIEAFPGVQTIPAGSV